MMSLLTERGIPSLKNRTEDPQEGEELSQQVYYAIASVYALLAVIGFIFNTLVLVAFAKDSSLRSHSNILILSIAVGDWIQAVVAYPLGIVGILTKSWQSTGTSCVCYGFMVTFLSFGTMLHHATFAIERAIVIKFSFSFSIVQKLKYIIVGLWLFSLIWSTLPLIGWSGYAPEGGRSVCSIDWQNSSPSAIAYIWCIFVLFFIAPFTTMVTAYSSIYRNVKMMTRTAHNTWGENAAPTLETVLAESKTARMACIMSFCFLFAWTPYAVVSLYAVILAPEPVISPLVATLPALFAKTAPWYNPLIYFLLFKKFRSSLRKVLSPFPICKRFIRQESSAENMEVISSLTGFRDKENTRRK
ncbi:visual pigment-like receptor peropsin [Stylophora pistillata]|uniref:visual pigment-like receptor peropsin n=1 Tax=Stylophora pistillata TaxID=50429 RepID=UPI000C03C1E5|nr:visual pigment-like receptor peropsin [Stylophora pistillata]XP_022802595.1 visual pigment-like receptor peropsin [Stylophora pistillata]